MLFNIDPYMETIIFIIGPYYGTFIIDPYTILFITDPYDGTLTNPPPLRRLARQHWEDARGGHLIDFAARY